MKTNQLLTELQYKAVRSSGAGGQNVNKVSSKVVLTFNLRTSLAFSYEEKEWLVQKLQNKLSSESLLIITCDEDRSQLKNKTIVTKRFLELIDHSLKIPKKRQPTKIPRQVIEKRIKAKRSLSEIKQNRRKPLF
jgi:ribosome-associated protein